MLPSGSIHRASAVFLTLTIAFALLLPTILFAHRSHQSPNAPTATAHALTANLTDGKQIFERHCGVCHGIDGGGGRGPRLTRPRLPQAPDDAALRSVIAEGLPPAMPDAWFLNEKEVANVAAYVRSLGTIPPEKIPGDPTRGVAVYKKSACAGCHMFAGEGVGFGPDLTDIGDRCSPSFVRRILVKPSTALPENFLFVKLTTASGQTLQGIRLNEDSFSIQIRDNSGRPHSFRKQELQDLQKLRGETPMPSFEGVLSAAELDDLVVYLVTPRGKP